MVFLLASLPPEIFTYHLAPFLEPQDIINVCVCGKFPITPGLYHRVFHDNAVYKEYNLAMFQDRARAVLYTFGDAKNGKLGTRETPGPLYHETVYSPDGKGPFSRVYCPIELGVVDGPIKKVTTDAESIQILAASGDLYFTGHTMADEHDVIHQTPKMDCPFCSRRVFEWCHVSMLRRQALEIPAYVLQAVQAEYKQTLQRRYQAPFPRPMRIEDAFVKDYEVLVRDNQGLVWKRTVSEPVPNHDALSLVVFVGSTGRGLYALSNVVLDRCLELRPRSALFENKGLAILGPEIALTGRFITEIGVTLVPGTETGVRNWVDLQRGVVYLRGDGTVTFVNSSREAGLGDPAADPKRYTNSLNKINALGRYVQISGSGNRFALVADNGTVVVASMLYDNFTHRFTIKALVLEELRDLDIASISVGTQHCLALTKQGDVYSWGEEKDLSGCLGLGTLSDALKVEGVTLKDVQEETSHHYRRKVKVHTNLALSVPTKIRMSGRAYGVYAGNNYSAVLVRDRY